MEMLYRAQPNNGLFCLVVVRSQVRQSTATSRLKHYLTSYLTSEMPSSSSARKLKIQQSQVFQGVEDSPNLLDLLETAISPARQAIFIEKLLEALPSAFAQFDKSPEELFTIFTAWFGKFSDPDYPFNKIHAALKYREKYFFDIRKKKKQFMRDIGLDWKEATKAEFFSKVYFLSDLVMMLISLVDR